MPDYTQFDLVDVLTGTAARMGWEAVAAETSATHAVLSFRNPATIAQTLVEPKDPPTPGGNEDGPRHRDRDVPPVAG